MNTRDAFVLHQRVEIATEQVDAMMKDLKTNWPKEMWMEIFLTELAIIRTRLGMVESDGLKQVRIITTQLENIKMYASSNCADGDRKRRLLMQMNKIQQMFPEAKNRIEMRGCRI